MMRFIPTKSGGRVAQGKTPYGDYRVEWDSTGQIVKEEMTILNVESKVDEFKKNRLQICKACADQDCPVKHKTSCQMNKWLAKPMACCPADPPKWKPIK